MCSIIRVMTAGGETLSSCGEPKSVKERLVCFVQDHIDPHDIIQPCTVIPLMLRLFKQTPADILDLLELEEDYYPDIPFDNFLSNKRLRGIKAFVDHSLFDWLEHFQDDTWSQVLAAEGLKKHTQDMVLIEVVTRAALLLPFAYFDWEKATAVVAALRVPLLRPENYLQAGYGWVQILSEVMGRYRSPEDNYTWQEVASHLRQFTVHAMLPYVGFNAARYIPFARERED